MKNNNNTPKKKSFTKTEAALRAEIAAHPFWHRSQYQCIQVLLPDRSSFFLQAGFVLEHSAKFLASQVDASPEAVLLEQLLPLVIHDPRQLIEMAKRIPPEVIYEAAQSPYWRTAKILAYRWWPEEALVTLNNSDSEVYLPKVA